MKPYSTICCKLSLIISILALSSLFTIKAQPKGVPYATFIQEEDTRVIQEIQGMRQDLIGSIEQQSGQSSILAELHEELAMGKKEKLNIPTKRKESPKSTVVAKSGNTYQQQSEKGVNIGELKSQYDADMAAIKGEISSLKRQLYAISEQLTLLEQKNSVSRDSDNLVADARPNSKQKKSKKRAKPTRVQRTKKERQTQQSQVASKPEMSESDKKIQKEIEFLRSEISRRKALQAQQTQEIQELQEMF